MKVLGGILVVCLVLAGAMFILSPTPAEARFRMDSNGFSYAYSYAWQHQNGQQSEPVTEGAASDQDQALMTGSGLRGPYGLQDGTCDPEQPQDGTGFGYLGGR